MANLWMTLTLLVSLITVLSAQVIDNNGSNSSEESVELAKYKNKIESSCRQKTGSNATYEALVANTASSQQCVMSSFDAEHFPADLDNLKESTRVPFFNKYCPQLHAVLDCMEPMTTELRKCLDPDEVKLLDIISNILPEGINLACKDNGQIFFMHDENFNECANKFAGYVRNCTYQVLNSSDPIDLSNFGPKQCDELGQVRECMEQQLVVECGAPRLMDFFDLFYRPIMKASPCKDHVKLDELPQMENNVV